MSAATSQPPYRHRFTVQEYHRMAEVGMLRAEDRVELIDGEIIHMSPIGHRHAGTVARIARHFNRLDDRVLVWVQSPVSLDDHGEPEPDITLLRPQSDFYVSALPDVNDVLLMIEVGDSTLTYDLNTKRKYYAEHGIVELWVVDAIRLVVHVCRDPREGEYRDVRPVSGDDLLAPLAFPGHIAPVRDIIG